MARAGALTTVMAIGPQDEYMYVNSSNLPSEIKKHSNFSIGHRVAPLLSPIGYLGQQCTFQILPKQEADLLGNIFLSVSLPALPAGYNYCELIGRALIKKAEFIINGKVIESLEDDWYILRDQLFLSADEKLTMYNNISAGQAESNVVPATTQVNLMIPLDFFFCRHKRDQKNPYLPLCALYNSLIIVRITFNPQYWITNYTAAAIELINPKIILQEISLTKEEVLHYTTQLNTFKIPVASKEAVQTYNNGVVRMNLTADFNVSMLVWFVRNQVYESTSPVYYANRYTYGYSTDYIVSAIPITFFNGVSQNFVDIIKSATIFINNQNILTNFPGALYYSFKQPFDHGLSIPTKSMYVYCFGDNPSTYSQDGTINFKNLNSSSTYIDMTFDPTLTTQIVQSYNMYLYYYGYKTLLIDKGRVSVRV